MTFYFLWRPIKVVFISTTLWDDTRFSNFRDKGRKVSTTRGADAVTSVNHGGNRARESSTYQQLASSELRNRRCCGMKRGREERKEERKRRKKQEQKKKRMRVGHTCGPFVLNPLAATRCGFRKGGAGRSSRRKKGVVTLQRHFSEAACRPPYPARHPKLPTFSSSSSSFPRSHVPEKVDSCVDRVLGGGEERVPKRAAGRGERDCGSLAGHVVRSYHRFFKFPVGT